MRSDHVMLAGFGGVRECIIFFICFLESVLTARTAMVFVGHIYLVVHRLPTGLTLPPSNRDRLVASHKSLHEDTYEVHDVETEKHYPIRDPF